nr:unnamed protein product [Digitaria exilis]
MASGNASALQMATVAGCILLFLAASMAPRPVMADCAGACADACEKYAQALCSGFNADKCDKPLPAGTASACHEVNDG